LPKWDLGITLANLWQIIQMEAKHESAHQYCSGRLDSGGSFHGTRSVFATYAASVAQSNQAGRWPHISSFQRRILVGNTLYLAGRIGIDPKTGKVPEKIEDEIKLLLDGEKEVLAQAGMTMDDLVYVQIACTDLSLFQKFNPFMRAIFRRKIIPRANLSVPGRFDRRPLRTASDRCEEVREILAPLQQARISSPWAGRSAEQRELERFMPINGHYIIDCI